MVDIPALMRALPISGLEPKWLASLGGLVDGPKDRDWQERIHFVEPPAGQCVPYIDPVPALEKLLRRQGAAKDVAFEQTQEAVAEMRACIDANLWVCFFDSFDSDSPEHLPVHAFVSWLRNAALFAPDVADFFDRAAEVAATTPMFRGPDRWDSPWSLAEMPESPPPKAMIEFVPGAPWNDFQWDAKDNPFLTWREAIRPVAMELEKVLSEPVYYFADLQDELDDDAVHRFLVLHWCCTYKPESAFVKHLWQASGASSVEELKAALIDPASYTQPFKMNDAFVGLETLWCEFEYLPSGRRKTASIVYSTLAARQVAESLLRQQIGVDVQIIAPPELMPDDWVKQTTGHCRSWMVQYLRKQTLERPIEVLALVDELCVIANEKTPGSGFDLKLPDTIEDMLWLAFELGIRARYFFIDGLTLANPVSSLEKRGARERAAKRFAQREAFTRQLTEIRLDVDYDSSGLWNERGQMLGYDLLQIPFALVRRIAAWQRNFDETDDPPKHGDDAWWERHVREKIEIATALLSAMGPGIAIKVYRTEGWTPIGDVISGEGQEDS